MRGEFEAVPQFGFAYASTHVVTCGVEHLSFKHIHTHTTQMSKVLQCLFFLICFTPTAFAQNQTLSLEQLITHSDALVEEQ